jgi:signal transduction histidine kinase
MGQRASRDAKPGAAVTNRRIFPLNIGFQGPLSAFTRKRGRLLPVAVGTISGESALFHLLNRNIRSILSSYFLLAEHGRTVRKRKGKDDFIFLPVRMIAMEKSGDREVDALKTQCATLEEQVKLLVKTDSELRRTQAELIESKKKIEEYSRTLEQKVEERTRELLRMDEKLKRAEKMEAVGILAGSVAHDLNNILNGVIGYPEILLQKVPADSPLKPYILAILECGENAAAVVQDLLVLARRGVIVSEVVNINSIVHKAMSSPEFVKFLADRPTLELKKDLKSPLRGVQGSSIHIYTSLTNILVNAAEAMPGGGRITVATDDVSLTSPREGYELIAPGEYVSIRISDSGAGIPKKDLNRIFEPFYTKKKMGKSGTGLGLAIVWGTVRDHKGFIDVESEEGVGTTFTLYFPATGESAATPLKHSDPADYRGNNESILIVDDVEMQRNVCMEILTQLGYSVESVASGEEAVYYLESRKVDLLVLDMIMDPGIDGLETYKRILRLHPGQKAVIASGFAENSLVKEAQMLGAGPFLKKPYTMEQIGTTVRKVLQRAG